MADKVAGLLFRISADTKALQQGMKQAQTATSKMKASMKALGVAMLATFSVRAVTNFVKASVAAYDIQAKAETKLLTALKGRSDIQERLMRQASDLQKVTIFGDEATIEAQALLASLGLTEKQITMLIPKVQDMATGLGMDLVGAASLVGKTVTTTTDALARYFDTGLKGVSDQSERAAVLTQALTDKFEGQAEAAAKAGTGGLTQLKNVLGDIKEELAGVALKTSNFNEKMSDLAGTLGGIDWDKVFKGIGTGLSFMGKNIQKVLPFVSQLASQLSSVIALAKIVAPKKDTKAPPPIGTPAKIGGKPLPQVPNVGVVSSSHLLGDFVNPGTALPGMQSLGFGGFDTSGLLGAGADELRKMPEILREVGSAMLDLSGIISDTFAAAANSFFASVERLAGGGKFFASSFKEVMHKVGKFMQQMGAMIAAYGVAALAMDLALVNPVGAIIAGTALATLGSLIAGLASRGPSGTSVSGGGMGNFSQRGGLANIQVEGIVRGSDLYLVSSNYQSQKGRM